MNEKEFEEKASKIIDKYFDGQQSKVKFTISLFKISSVLDQLKIICFASNIKIETELIKEGFFKKEIRVSLEGNKTDIIRVVNFINNGIPTKGDNNGE